MKAVPGGLARGRAITRRKVLVLVEGAHLAHFLEAQLRDLSRSDVAIRDFGGVNELPRRLSALVNEPGFRRIERLGIVRDAEESARSALQSLQSACAHVNLATPRAAGVAEGTNPSVRYWILPGEGRPGMLETLLWETVASTPAGECVEKFFDCVRRVGEVPARYDKARAYAWIATRAHPEVSAGIAARKGYWNLRHEAFGGLRRFLREL